MCDNVVHPLMESEGKRLHKAALAGEEAAILRLLTSLSSPSVPSADSSIESPGRAAPRLTGFTTSRDIYTNSSATPVVKRLRRNPPTSAHSGSSTKHADDGTLCLSPEVLKVLKYTDGNGCTALHKACKKGHVSVVKILAIGEACQAVSHIGNNPLMEAVVAGRSEVIQLFIDLLAKSEITIDCFRQKNKEDQTVLHLAASRGQVAILELLLKAGVGIEDWPSVFDFDAHDRTPVHYAAAYNHRKALLALLEGRDEAVFVAGKDMWRPIHSAAQFGSNATLSVLLKHSNHMIEDDVDADSSRDKVENGQKRPRGYADSGAGAVIPSPRTPYVNCKVKGGNTALHLAAFAGHHAVVASLIGAGADIATYNQKGRAALHLAITSGQLEAVKILIESVYPGADVDAVDMAAKWASFPSRDGSSPLYFAVAGGQADIVEYLLACGASTTAINRSGEGLAHAIARGATVDVLKVLKDHNVAVSWTALTKAGKSMLHTLDCSDATQVLTQLQKYGGLPLNDMLNQKDKKGDTPLHTAVRELRADAAESLIALRASRHADNAAGQKPLDILMSMHIRAARKSDSRKADRIAALFQVQGEGTCAQANTEHIDVDLACDSDIPDFIAPPILVRDISSGSNAAVDVMDDTVGLVQIVTNCAAPATGLQATATQIATATPAPAILDEETQRMWQEIVKALRVIDHLELEVDLALRPLGHGGQGFVREALWTPPHGGCSSERVAVKHISDERHAYALVKEAYIHTLCRHRNIVRVRGITPWPPGASRGAAQHAEVDPFHFALVLELAEHGSLRTHLSSSDDLGDIAQRLRHCWNLACALDYMHSQTEQVSLIHGDIKPENVLIIKTSGSCDLKLTDFGLSKSRQRPAHGDDNTLAEMGGKRPGGTPAYMSPEQLEGGNIGRRTDVWSFGLLMYEIVTGRLPWDEKIPSNEAGVAKISRLIAQHKRPSLLSLPEDLTSAAREILERLLSDCWHFEPTKRPLMVDVAARLREAVRLAKPAEP